MDLGSVHLASPWHQFRAFSELKNESRGGYLEGEISVPRYVSRIRISLATHDPTPESHVNLLFETPRNKIATHCQEMKPSDHGIILHKVNDAFELEQPSYWPNAQPNRPQFWINGKLVLGKNNLQLTICKAVQKGQSKISVSEMVKYLNLRQFKGDLEKATLKVIFDDNPPIYSKVILDKAKYLIKIDAIRTRYICDQADQLLTIYFNKSVKITQDKCLKLTLFRSICSEDIDFTTYRIVADNVVEFKVNASRIGACAKVYVVVSIDDQDIDGTSLYDQISDDLTIEIKKHFEHPEYPCFCKIFSATDFKPTKVRNNIRSRPYPINSVPGEPVPSTSGGARPRTIRRPQRPNQRQAGQPQQQIRQPELNMQSQQGQQQPLTRLQNAVQEPQVRHLPQQGQLLMQPSTSRGARPRTTQSLQSNIGLVAASAAEQLKQALDQNDRQMRELIQQSQQRHQNNIEKQLQIASLVGNQQPRQVYNVSQDPYGGSLPQGWEVRKDSYGRAYYADLVNGTSQWQHPGSQDRVYQCRPSQPQQPTSQNIQIVGQPQLQQTNSSSRPQPTLSHTGFSSRPQGPLGPIPATVPSDILQDSDSDEGWQLVTENEPPSRPLEAADERPEPQESGQHTPEPSSNVAYVGAISCVPVDKSEEDDVCLSINALTICTDDEGEDQGDIFVRHVGNASSSPSTVSDTSYYSNFGDEFKQESDSSSDDQDDHVHEDDCEDHDQDQEDQCDQDETYEDDQHDSDEDNHGQDDNDQDGHDPDDQDQDDHDQGDHDQDDYDYDDCNGYDDYNNDYYDYSSDYSSDY